jgi:hypothetical protein
MAKRVKHLLEAFQQTGAAGRPAGTQPSAPLAQSQARPASAGSRASAGPVLSQVWITHGIVLCVGLLIGVLAGRFARPTEAAGPGSNSPGVVEPRLQGGPAGGDSAAKLAGRDGSNAAENASSGASSNSGTASTSGTAASVGTAAIDSALRDKANRYTLLAITYGNSPANHELARTTASYLRSKELPACDPVLRGKTLCVLVGAAASKAQLQVLQTKLRDTLGPSGRGQDFTTAYPVDIDTYIAR